MIPFEIFKSVEICMCTHRLLLICHKYTYKDSSSLDVHRATVLVVCSDGQICIICATWRLGKYLKVHSRRDVTGTMTNHDQLPVPGTWYHLKTESQRLKDFELRVNAK